MSPALNILQLCRNGTRALGPGLRYVVWVQGCPFRCPHCETPEGRSFSPNILINVNELAQDIIKRPEIDGITISGGEPMEQAGLLADLLGVVLAGRPELNVISYTGYQIEQLKTDDALRFISHLDVLIDGQYIHEKNDNRGLRGSSNQRVHFLTDRLSSHAKMFTEDRRKLEIRFKGPYVSIIGLTNADYTGKELPVGVLRGEQFARQDSISNNII